MPEERKEKVPENLVTSVPNLNLTLDSNPLTGNPLICSETRFKCRNGHCVDRSFLCNGQDNCQDNSDEELCLTTAGESDVVALPMVFQQLVNHSCSLFVQLVDE